MTRVLGFGSCLINGFGVGGAANGFFDAALAEWSANGGEVVRHLDTKDLRSIATYLPDLQDACQTWQPDIVILQIPSADAFVPVKRRIPRRIRRFVLGPAADQEHELRPHTGATLKFLLKQSFKFSLGFLVGARPLLSYDQFRLSFEQVLQTLASSGAEAFVVGFVPLVDFRSRLLVAKYAKLAKTMCAAYKVHYIDPCDLVKIGMKDAFLSDGAHLTIKAHQIIGKALADAMTAAVPRVKEHQADVATFDLACDQ